MLKRKIIPLLLITPFVVPIIFAISCSKTVNPVPASTHTFTLGALPNFQYDSSPAPYQITLQHTGDPFNDWSNFALESSNPGVLEVVGNPIVDALNDSCEFNLLAKSLGSSRLELHYIGTIRVNIYDEALEENVVVHEPGYIPSDPALSIARANDDSLSRETITYGNLDEFVDIILTLNNFPGVPGVPTISFLNSSPQNILSDDFLGWTDEIDHQRTAHLQIHYNPIFSKNFTAAQTPAYQYLIKVNVNSGAVSNAITSDNEVAFNTAQWDADANEYSSLNEESLDYLTYLHTLTFSIYSGTQPTSGYIGTGWILGKYCTWNGNDWDVDTGYNYWMATNLHVRASIEEANSSSGYGNALWWNDNITTKSVNQGRSSSLSKTLLTPETNYFATDRTDTFGRHYTMDFSVVKYSAPTIMSTALQNKLNAVNQICTDLANNPRGLAIQPVSSEPVGIQNLYVLGYPSSEVSADQGLRLAKKHTFGCSSTNYYTSKQTMINSPVYTSADSNDYYDTGVVIETGSYQGTRGGSSGSLVLNDQGQAVAINFAGPADNYFDANGYSLYTSLYKNGTGAEGYDLINGSYPAQGGFYEYLKTI